MLSVSVTTPYFIASKVPIVPFGHENDNSSLMEAVIHYVAPLPIDPSVVK